MATMLGTPRSRRRRARRPAASGQLAALAIAMLAAPGAAVAGVVEIGPADDLQAAVDALQPGDELVLRGGTYLPTSRFSIQAVGTSGAPIVIRAKAGETPIVTYGNASQNVINVENAAHLVLRGLEVTGGSHGIRIHQSSFVTVEACHIHHTGDVGLSANTPGSTYVGLRLLRNQIHDTSGTGEGMYLGCNSDACRLLGSRIEGNWVHHTNGPGVTQGDGIEIKEGSAGNLVRDNVVHDTGYPCLLTYGTVGNGPPNVLERNLLWSCGDHAIQVAADAVIRNNLILGAVADGIRHQPHQAAAPANLVVVHNTVLEADGNAFRAAGIVGAIVVANNAFYSPSGYALRIEGELSGVTVAGNVGAGALLGIAAGFDDQGSTAADFVGAGYSGVPPQDLYPAAGSRLIAAGDPAHAAPDDFDGKLRDGATDVGAYRWDPAGAPTWALAAGFKPSPTLFEDDFEGGNVAAWSAVAP